ncbi:hypothetical protein D3C75_407540 [compost metagenome]
MKPAGKYVRCYVLGIQNAMEYRADFWLSMVGQIFPLLIQVFLWKAIFTASDSQQVYGYTFNQMIVYTLMALAVGKVVSGGFEYEIAADIKNGGLSKFIVQPVSYFGYRVSSFYGGKTVQLLFFGIIVTAALGGIALFGELPLTGGSILLFIPSVLMGIVLNGMIFYLLSLLAFWITEVWAVFLGFNVLSNILSGGVFPLDVFGDTANRVFGWLPFRYTIYFPINVLNGKLSLHEVLAGLGWQAVWTIIVILLAGGCWRHGLNRYAGIGG